MPVWQSGQLISLKISNVEGMLECSLGFSRIRHLRGGSGNRLAHRAVYIESFFIIGQPAIPSPIPFIMP